MQVVGKRHYGRRLSCTAAADARAHASADTLLL
jgi:hypothetical protein